MRLSDVMSVREMGVRLHQRAAEIYDGLMELDRYLEERTGPPEGGRTGVPGSPPRRQQTLPV